MNNESKNIEYWKNNAKEDYIKTPISVLRYITELEKLTNQEQKLPIDLVIGCFYWVKHTETCEYEPAIAECRYEKGVLYFCFTCGGAVKCDSVVDYKKLNYR